MSEKQEMCITHEEYKALYDLVSKTDSRVTAVEANVGEIQTDTKKTLKMITGNGEPESGLAWKLSFMQRILNDHLAFHKGVQNKLWDVAKPIVNKLVEWSILGGLMWYIVNNVVTHTH